MRCEAIRMRCAAEPIATLAINPAHRSIAPGTTALKNKSKDSAEKKRQARELTAGAKAKREKQPSFSYSASPIQDPGCHLHSLAGNVSSSCILLAQFIGEMIAMPAVSKPQSIGPGRYDGRFLA
uniref:Uncharacterized protein n=1 Tax=Plectus sambesii TaxID=2011161 RepID=A0A914WUZ8_9BILA